MELFNEVVVLGALEGDAWEATQGELGDGRGGLEDVNDGSAHLGHPRVVAQVERSERREGERCDRGREGGKGTETMGRGRKVKVAKKKVGQ